MIEDICYRVWGRVMAEHEDDVVCLCRDINIRVRITGAGDLLAVRRKTLTQLRSQSGRCGVRHKSPRCRGRPMCIHRDHVCKSGGKEQECSLIQSIRCGLPEDTTASDTVVFQDSFPGLRPRQ